MTALEQKLESVRALHRAVKRWQPHEDYECSFATEAEARSDDDDEEAMVTFFEICAECGRVESEQFNESGEEWGYRESLWPCPTAKILNGETK